MRIHVLTAAVLLTLAATAHAQAPATPGLAVDDSIITAKIKSALIQEPSARARDVKVKTRHGKVRLSGSVDSQEVKQRAEVIAGTTEGVTAVHNELKVRGGAGR